MSSQDNYVSLIKKLDHLASPCESIGRRGQFTNLRAALDRDLQPLDVDLDDAEGILRGFEVLMGSKVSMPDSEYEPTGTLRVKPFVEENRSARSIRRRDSAAREARVELIEKFWEGKRRRRMPEIYTHRLFSYGGVWSQDARVIADRNERAGLILEHVVPASTVSILVADLVRRKHIAEQTGDSRDFNEELVHLLRGLITHVVITREEDRKYLDRSMDHNAELRLRRHFSSTELLSEEELLRVKWSRYLGRSNGDLESFPIESLSGPGNLE